MATVFVQIVPISDTQCHKKAGEIKKFAFAFHVGKN